VIFSRGRGAGKHAKDAGRAGKHERGRDDDDQAELEFEDDSEAPPTPEFGPYDIDEAPDDGVDRLDLGALRIPAIADVEIQLQAGPEGQIQQILLVHGDSRLQLAAFAAPRTEGIWDEMRAELRSTLHANGARPQEVEGEYGVELRARVKDAEGQADLRFVGVDGPRWLVRGVYRGTAATDPSRAGPLRDAMRGLVVDRGPQAMPVSEVLPLRLPPEAAAQLGEAVASDAAAGPAARSAGAAPPRSGQARSGQTGSGQTGSGQTGSGQTGSGQTGSGPAGTDGASAAPTRRRPSSKRRER